MERGAKYLLAAVLALGLVTAAAFMTIKINLPPVFNVLAGGLLDDLANLGGQGAISAVVNAIMFITIACMTWAMYFLPSFLAFQSRHPKDVAIFWLNLFTGWTLIGWFVTFFWVMRSDKADPDERKNAEI
ncbi:MAG: superinfection immunity protein [Zoogloeaceae bacterium]|jgi:hypothetical protein|nr:superinfection immunity protein [Zoogloeaceae bacterium]